MPFSKCLRPSLPPWPAAGGSERRKLQEQRFLRWFLLAIGGGLPGGFRRRWRFMRRFSTGRGGYSGGHGGFLVVACVWLRAQSALWVQSALPIGVRVLKFKGEGPRARLGAFWRVPGRQE